MSDVQKTRQLSYSKAPNETVDSLDVNMEQVKLLFRQAFGIKATKTDVAILAIDTMLDSLVEWLNNARSIEETWKEKKREMTKTVFVDRFKGVIEKLAPETKKIVMNHLGDFAEEYFKDGT